MGLVALWHVGSSQTRDGTLVSCTDRWLLTTEPPEKSHTLKFGGTKGKDFYNLHSNGWKSLYCIWEWKKWEHSLANVAKDSVQFNRSVVSDSLWPHEPQHARPSCPWPTPGVNPNTCPLCRWCHPTISSSVVPFSSCPPMFKSITVGKSVWILYKNFVCTSCKISLSLKINKNENTN